MQCCLCGDRDALHQEERQSGDHGELEEWQFCPVCFMELQRQLKDHDPYIAKRYETFIKFIVGGYRVQREFRGNQASGLQPEKKIDINNSMSIESGNYETITDEHTGRTSQEIQEILLRDREGNDGNCPEADRRLLGEGGTETEKITRAETDPAAGATATGP